MRRCRFTEFPGILITGKKSPFEIKLSMLLINKQQWSKSQNNVAFINYIPEITITFDLMYFWNFIEDLFNKSKSEKITPYQ